jgi:phosphoglycolate phosphatase-like HAD superfamily hydrolase
MAIVTSSYRERLVVPYLRRHGLSGYFAAIVGSEDTDTLKPSPEPVLAALRLLDADPTEAWMIGDSVADVAAARSAGIRSIALGHEAIGADRVAESADALRVVLAGLVPENEYSARAGRRGLGTVVTGEGGEHL